MARVVLDLPKLRMNPRYKALIRKCHSEREAIGMLAEFYELAQEHWAHERLVPKEEFELAGFIPILEVGLAKDEGGGVYAKGGEERFAWLRDRVTAGKIGGQKSAKKRKERFGTAQPNSPKQTRSTPEANPKHSFENPEAPPKPTVTSTVTSTSLIPFSSKTAAPENIRSKIAKERALEKRAAFIADSIIGAVRSFPEDEMAAKERVTPFGWSIIENKWLTWERFTLDAAKNFQGGKGPFFEHQLRQSVIAALLVATDGQHSA